MSFEITDIDRKFDKITVFYNYTNPMDFVSKTKYPDIMDFPIFSSEDHIIKAIREKLRNKFADDLFGSMFEEQKKKLIGNTYDIFQSSRRKAK